MAAAVADFHPAAAQGTKLKRSGKLTVELEPTTDILAELARAEGEHVLVGFAAETDSMAESAREKLQKKNVDLIVANDVTAAGAGFDVETNVVTFLRRNGGETALPRMSKFDVANRVLDEVLRLRRGAP